MQKQELETETIDYDKYTIHIVDDSSLVVNALTDVLKSKDYIVVSSNNGEEALKNIFCNKPDLIILDVEMPVMDGYETIKHLKNNENTVDIPVIFLTGLTKPEIIKNIFEIGAADYISKPFVNEEILARIEKEIKTIMLQKMLKEKMSKLAELLSIDSLTKTSNKMHMTSILKVKLEKLKADKINKFLLMYIDIDNFHLFVKKYGINSSEDVLKKISTVIKKSINEKNVLSHWHGDVFMILFEKTSMDDVYKTAKIIKNNISQGSFYPKVNITCSISITEPSAEDNVKQVIEKLQNSMKEVKRINKGSIIKALN